MQIRIFGSTSCQDCNTICNGLVAMGYSFEFVDALDENNDPICDANNVLDLPHVQIVDDNEKILWEKVKGVSLTNIFSQIKKYDIKS